MRLRELLLMEEMRNVIYHYTSAWALAKMLEEKRIGLTLATGSDILAGEHNAQNMYFLSGTRSKIGHYTSAHEGATGGVVLVLNGDLLRQRQSVRPVDYWGREYRKVDPKRNEMEERVYSRTPYLALPPNPRDLILAAHMLIANDTDDRFRQAIFAVVTGTKKAGIPFYVYQNARAWLLQDTRRAMPMSDVIALLKQIPARAPYGGASYRRPSKYGGYVELFQRPVGDRERLTQAGKYLLGRINTWEIARGDARRSIEAEIHGDRSPSSLRHADLVEFMEFLRRHGYVDVNKFLADLSQKWHPDQYRPLS